MAPKQPLFLPSGKLYKGPTHRMGSTIMTGAVHTPASQVLHHKSDNGMPMKKSMDMASRMAKLRSMKKSK